MLLYYMYWCCLLVHGLVLSLVVVVAVVVVAWQAPGSPTLVMNIDRSLPRREGSSWGANAASNAITITSSSIFPLPLLWDERVTHFKGARA